MSLTLPKFSGQAPTSFSSSYTSGPVLGEDGMKRKSIEDQKKLLLIRELENRKQTERYAAEQQKFEQSIRMTLAYQQQMIIEKQLGQAQYLKDADQTKYEAMKKEAGGDDAAEVKHA
jgi:predicted secreted protein